MIITRHDTPIITSTKTEEKPRQRDPNSLLAISERYGINRSTLRNRIKAGMRKGMTMQEAIDKALEDPIKTRLECGQMAAKARWGGTK